MEVGDFIRFKGDALTKHSDYFSVSKWITSIPTVIHGDTKIKENLGEITGFHVASSGKQWVVVRYKGYNGKDVQLGFLPEHLDLIVTQKSFRLCYKEKMDL